MSEKWWNATVARFTRVLFARCVAEPNRLSCKSDMRLEFMIRLGILGGDLTAVTATV